MEVKEEVKKEYKMDKCIAYTGCFVLFYSPFNFQFKFLFNSTLIQ